MIPAIPAIQMVPFVAPVAPTLLAALPLGTFGPIAWTIAGVVALVAFGLRERRQEPPAPLDHAEHYRDAA